MINLVLYCLGAALFPAVVFLPLAYLIMKAARVTFKGGLGKAWKPFAYSLPLLMVEKFIELGTHASQDTTTAAGIVWYAVVPTVICAMVLYLTYRDRASTSAPSTHHDYRGEQQQLSGGRESRDSEHDPVP